MMLGNPLLIWGRLANPRSGYRLCERAEMEREIGLFLLVLGVEMDPVRVVCPCGLQSLFIPT